MQLIAPERFLEHAVSENVYAGTAMARRAGYMYGSALDRGPWGQVGSGLGNATSTGVMGIEVPTHQVDKTGETVTVAGVEMEFQMTPNTEATHVWSTYLDEAIDLFADRSELVFPLDHWPKWARRKPGSFLSYKASSTPTCTTRPFARSTRDTRG